MNEQGAGAIGLVVLVIYLAIVVFYLAAGWKIFTKAGKPGWAILIPVYNLIVYLEIVGRPMWWLLLIFFVPIVNIIVLIILTLDLAKSFGKDTGWGVLMLIILGFIGYPMLAFGNAQYTGPAVKKA